MKTFFKTFIAAVSAVTIFFFGGGLGQLAAKGDITGYAESHIYGKELTDLYADENGDFKVLQFSDTHFTTGLSWNDISTLLKMESIITEYAPDLVVISGDLIDDGDSGAYNKQYVLDTVMKLFEKHEQYWAYIPGNNDGINYGSSADVTAYLSQSEYCLASDEKDISGGAQYSIDIKNGENILVHSLVFLDTMDYDDEDSEHIYGYVHDDQVEWCKNEIASKLTKNESVSISVFLHENTPDFANAAVLGERYKNEYPTIEKSDEKFNIPKNQPLDDVFNNAGCVGLVSIGHVHPSGCRCSFYNGTYYHITPRVQTMSTLITIHTAEKNSRNMYDFEPIS